MGPEDSTSYVTFRSCVDTINILSPDMFLLENVDLEDEADGNLAWIVKILRETKYEVQVYKLISSDFALPQRRVRLYILGFSSERQSQVTWANIERRLDLFRIKSLSPATRLHNYICKLCFESQSRQEQEYINTFSSYNIVAVVEVAVVVV